MNNEIKRPQKWNDLNIKEKTQIGLATFLICSGTLMAFIAFFITLTIGTGTLIYIMEAYVTAAGLMGISMWVKSDLIEFKSNFSKTVFDEIDKHYNPKK